MNCVLHLGKHEDDAHHRKGGVYASSHSFAAVKLHMEAYHNDIDWCIVTEDFSEAVSAGDYEGLMRNLRQCSITPEGR